MIVIRQGKANFRHYSFIVALGNREQLINREQNYLAEYWRLTCGKIKSELQSKPGRQAYDGRT